MLKMDEAKIKALTDFKRLGKTPQGLSRQEGLKALFLKVSNVKCIPGFSGFTGCL